MIDLLISFSYLPFSGNQANFLMLYSLLFLCVLAKYIGGGFFFSFIYLFFLKHLFIYIFIFFISDFIKSSLFFP